MDGSEVKINKSNIWAKEQLLELGAKVVKPGCAAIG
jgi:hypothetical protein